MDSLVQSGGVEKHQETPGLEAMFIFVKQMHLLCDHRLVVSIEMLAAARCNNKTS